LLDAATAAIRSQGADASMVDIATEAGITKPILYSHFGDKAGLVAAMAERVVVDLNGHLLAALAAGTTPRNRTFATIGAFVEFVEREPELYRFLVRGMAQPGTSVQPDLVDRIGNQIAAVLTAALRQAGDDSGPAELWAHAIIGAVFFGAELWLVRPVVTRDQLIEDLTRLLWDGLGSTGVAEADTAAVQAQLSPGLG
jgi:AcrR family transcriptional regulator